MEENILNTSNSINEQEKSNLQKALEEGKFAVTCEIGPPKGTDISRFFNYYACDNYINFD